MYFKINFRPKFLLLFSLFLGFQGIAMADGNFKITGKFKNAAPVKNQYIYLYKNVGKTRLRPVDSAKVRATGGFSFNTKITNPDIYAIVFNRVYRIDIAPSAGEALNLVIDNAAIPFVTFTIKGSYRSIEVKKIYDFVTESRKRTLRVEESNYGNTVDTLNYLKSLTNILTELDSTNKFIRKYIKTQKDDLLRVYASSYLNEVEGNETINSLYNQVKDKKYPSDYIAEFVKQVEILNRLAIGKLAPDIKGKMYGGKNLKLSDLRGKTVLVYFWASWCVPARDDNKAWVKLYKKYKSKNLEVLGISLDTDNLKWENAILSDGLPWLNASELKGWKSEVVKDYYLTGIPFNILINFDGKILAKNIKLKEADGVLNRLLK